MAAYLSPVFGAGAQLFSNAGVVLAGGKIATYLAGTTTPASTWTDSTQAVANANPIILDSAGRLPNEMWLQSNQAYKLILMDSASNILGTWDNVSGVNDVILTNVVSEWVSTGLTPSYISSTSFSVPGNNVASFAPNRRLQLAVTAGTIYGYVETSSFGGGITTITVQPDSTVIDSGISSVNIGLLNSLNTSYPQQLLAMNAAISLAAASTTAIGAALSANIVITGTTTITAFDNELPGIIKFVSWSAATPITYNATNMQLISSVSRTNNVGDFSIFKSLGSGNWVEEVYQQRTGNISANAATATLAATLASGATAVTQAGQDNSTKIATDEYVDRQHDSQIFTANGTWTKPSWVMPNMVVEIEMWGGGGGRGLSGGGGGGAYNCRRVLASDLGATVSVTVGGGGTDGGAGTGGTGGTSSFGTLMSAFGGAGGADNIGGGGGGTKSAGTSGVTTGAGGLGYGITGTDGGGNGGSSAVGNPSFWGGGGGGGNLNNGGSSTFGGGGGSGQSGSGGLSLYGGNGGTTASGSIPGGGGGSNGASVGARGEVRVRILS